MLFDFATVLVFIIVGLLFVFGVLLFSRIIQPRKPNPAKASTYECGERSVGSTWVRFNIRFYVIALIYILFAAEVLLLFPWAVVYRQLGWVSFVEMIVFVSILLVGLAYLWRNGDLDWVKTIKETKSPQRHEDTKIQ